MANLFLRLIASFLMTLMAQQVFAARSVPFQVGDCEKLILGRKGDAARAVVRQWAADFNFDDLELLRVSISEDNLMEDRVYGDTEGEDEDRIHTRYKPPTVDQSLPLSPLELSALGIPQDSVVAAEDVRFSLQAKPSGELVLTSYKGRNKIGETVLSPDRLRIGFQNRVQFYQSYWKAEGFETDLETFFAEHGYVLLPAGRFAFVFPLIDTNTAPRKLERFEITIFTIRDCPGREALLMKDMLFPEKGQPSGARNICLDPLGLKIASPVKDQK